MDRAMSTPDLEKLARETASEVMGLYSQGLRGWDIIKPILSALQRAVVEKESQSTIIAYKQIAKELQHELAQVQACNDAVNAQLAEKQDAEFLVVEQLATVTAQLAAAKELSACFDEDGLLPVEPIRDGRGRTTCAVGTDRQIAALKKFRDFLADNKKQRKQTHER